MLRVPQAGRPQCCTGSGRLLDRRDDAVDSLCNQIIRFGLRHDADKGFGAGAGHGGMDFIEDYRLIACLRAGTPTDMNVYDAAALSAVVQADTCELYAQIVQFGTRHRDPDYTAQAALQPSVPVFISERAQRSALQR